MFADPDTTASPSPFASTDDSTDSISTAPKFPDRRVRSTINLAILGLLLSLFLGGMTALIGWLIDRSVSVRGREQTALVIAELRREDANRARQAIQNRAQGQPLDSQVDQLKADLAEINAKLTALALLGSAPPRGDPADASSRPPKRVNGALSLPGAGSESSVPLLSADLATIRREISDSEAASMRQLQEMRTVINQLNNVVRQVLSRPTPPDSSSVALPLLAVAVQALINNLQHQTTQVRGEAVEQLIRLGPLARSAVPALRQMVTRESDPNVRSAVETAISVLSSN